MTEKGKPSRHILGIRKRRGSAISNPSIHHSHPVAHHKELQSKHHEMHKEETVFDMHDAETAIRIKGKINEKIGSVMQLSNDLGFMLSPLEADADPADTENTPHQLAKIVKVDNQNLTLIGTFSTIPREGKRTQVHPQIVSLVAVEETASGLSVIDTLLTVDLTIAEYTVPGNIPADVTHLQKASKSLRGMRDDLRYQDRIRQQNATFQS